MPITTRLLVSLVLALTTVTSVFTHWQAGQERQRQMEELERRSRLLSMTLGESVTPLLGARAAAPLARAVDRFTREERVKGVLLYDAAGAEVFASPALRGRFSARPAAVEESRSTGAAAGGLEPAGADGLYLYARPLGTPPGRLGTLAVVQDTRHIQARLQGLWKNNFERLLVQAILVSLITLLILHWSVSGPIAQMAEWMKKLRAGERLEPFTLTKEGVFAPIAREVSTFAQHLLRAKSAAEEEARLRHRAEALWTPEKLRESVKNRLGGKPLLVISNREPCMHVFRGRKVESLIPAGGLVSALSPVLKATHGLWIAHGAGDADWETADPQGRLAVPPEDPQYTLRRIALTPAEEEGYYYGFSNEGLWPLCHIAHTRPLFRAEDWSHYRAVNRKFAAAALEEIRDLESPLVLVQDYHFALLPRYIKEKRPDARVALFWHIPWPNPEAFSICPWQKEILFGMLGADLVGFHIQFHCNNFLETVDRALECRIEWERFTVNKGGHATLVKPFPISVDFPPEGGAPGTPGKAALLKSLGIQADTLAVGVDRLDYTKGLIERFLAVERFLDKNPDQRGRFVFVELAAPSRTHIARYHDFDAEVDREIERINDRFQTRAWKPLVLLKKNHSPEEIRPFYRAADLCLVTSLHDGMNLVAKEFVAAREDGDGVLILSQFTGAARELREALIINPYDRDQTADAIHRALTMPAEERGDRMRRLRQGVREHNVYRWAGGLITELADLRVNARGDGVTA